MSDHRLAEITSIPATSIDEVVSIMEQIDGILPGRDGLKWFNLLYLKVTESVLNNPPAGGWKDAQWLTRLDVIFAGLYFNAVRNSITGGNPVPKAWRILLNARHRSDIMRVQFAICGMNAHINHDLQFAIVQACREQNFSPRLNTSQHQDFKYVNNILERVEPQMIQYLATGIVGVIDQSLGRLDNILAMWGVGEARDTAWANSEVLWHIRDNPILRKAHLYSVDKITGAFGRGLIIPI